jgi:hypothetical protein
MSAFSRLFSIPIIVFIFSACSTTAKISRIKATSDFPASLHGAIFVFKLESGAIVSEDGCSLALGKNDTLLNYDVEFQPGQDLVFAELPPGIYHYKEIDCGSTHWDLRFNEYPPFQVIENRAVLAAELSFQVRGVRNADISSDHFRKIESAGLLKKIPNSENHPLLSAFTGKTIPRSLIETPIVYKKWLLKDDTGAPIKMGKFGWPNFHLCYRDEAKRNGLYLGNLELSADYENGNLTDVKILDAPNTFTDHFIECAKATLQDFHPIHMQKSEYFLAL